MKRTLLTLPLICLLFVGCSYVKQEATSTCIVTYVWVDGEIVFSNRLPINSDSTRIKHMRDSAETILKNLKSLK